MKICNNLEGFFFKTGRRSLFLPAAFICSRHTQVLFNLISFFPFLYLSLMKLSFKKEIDSQIQKIKSLDKNIVTIFISVALLQVISYHFASIKYFYDSGLSGFVPDNISDLSASLYWFGLDIIILFLIPVLIIIFYFHESLKNYGLIFGDRNAGLKICMVVVLIMTVLLWFVSASEEFSLSYPSLKSAEHLSFQFLIYEIVLFFYIVAWEFIWRGYMLFGLEKKFGYYAVFMQMIPFVILHNGKPLMEMFGAIPGGIFLGILALRTRSIFYGVIIHFSVMFFIDLFSILRQSSGDYGAGYDSLINIFSHLF